MEFGELRWKILQMFEVVLVHFQIYFDVISDNEILPSLLIDWILIDIMLAL